MDLQNHHYDIVSLLVHNLYCDMFLACFCDFNGCVVGGDCWDANLKAIAFNKRDHACNLVCNP